VQRLAGSDEHQRGARHRGDGELQVGPETVTPGEPLGRQVRKQEQAPVAGLAHQVHTGLPADLPVLFADLALRCAACQGPLLEIDLAVMVQVELLEHLRLVLLPLREQRADVGRRVEGAAGAALGLPEYHCRKSVV